MKQEYNTQLTDTGFADSLLFKNSANEIFQNAYISSSHLSSLRTRNKILKSVGKKSLDTILPLMKSVHLEQGETVHKCGDKMPFLYFPESVVFSEYQITEDGKTVEVAMIGREGLLGTTSLFSSGIAANWSQVLIAGTAYRINTNIFRKHFNNCSEIQTGIFDFLNSYINQISQRVTCHSHHSLVERLCSYLSMIRDRCQTECLLMTQEKVASLLGTQRTAITAIMNSLRKKGIVRYSRGKIFILDRQQLEANSCDCYQAASIA